MHNHLKVALIVSLVVAGMLAIALLVSQSMFKRATTSTPSTSGPLNAMYIIENTPITLVNGFSEISAVPGSASKITTRYFGNEVRTDLNGDGREDAVFLLTQETGGSGTFYYAVAALNTEGGWVGSRATYLGDRIAPQTTEVSRAQDHTGVVVVNFADRAPGEPMTVAPSQSKSLYLKLDPASLQFGEVAKSFEGEVDTNAMSLGMKPWVWVKTTYNDGTELVPAKENAFTMTFSDGFVSITTDCNSMSGSYTVQENTISFGPLRSTRMYCEGSQETDFSTMLSEVRSFFFSGKGELVLELQYDSGSAMFR